MSCSSRRARSWRSRRSSSSRTQTQIGELEPLQYPRSFQLNYIKAQDILQPHHDATGSSNSARAPGRRRRPAARARSSRRRGVAIVDPRSNILFVQDTAVAARGSPPDHPADRHADPPGADRGAHRDRRRHVQPAARRALRPADGLHVQQRQYARGLGRHALDAAGRRTPKATGSSARRARRRRSSWRRASPIAGYSDSPQLNVNLPVPNAAGQLALTLINLGSGNLINLELSALEADNRGKVVSSPRVITGDNQKAHIEQGTEIPVRHAGHAPTRRRPCSSRRRCCVST